MPKALDRIKHKGFLDLVNNFGDQDLNKGSNEAISSDSDFDISSYVSDLVVKCVGYSIF